MAPCPVHLHVRLDSQRPSGRRDVPAARTGLGRGLVAGDRYRGLGGHHLPGQCAVLDIQRRQLVGDAGGDRIAARLPGAGGARADVGDPDIIAYIGCSYAGGNLQYSGGGNPAEVWGIDCTAGSVNGYGDYTATYLSGCTLETPSTTVDADRRDWPVPYGGLSAYWRSTLGFPTYSGPDLRT